MSDDQQEAANRKARESASPAAPAPPVVTPARPPLPEPPLADLATRLAYAAWRAGVAAVHGERVFVTAEELAAREASCAPCSYWYPEARAGLGRCTAPGCGCTKFKRELTTEDCKHPQGSRWPKIER